MSLNFGSGGFNSSGLFGTSTNPLGGAGGLNTSGFGSTNTTGSTSTGLNFGQTTLGAKPSDSLSTTLTASSNQPALGGSSTASNQNTTSTNSTSSNQAISFKIFEEYLNKWLHDLDSQERDFINQATQLNALDRIMVENGDKIIELSSEVTKLNNEQDQLDGELDFINSQQNDLEQSIKKLEMSIESMPILPLQISDTSRIEMYKLLVEVDNQLRSMSIDLKDIIKRLNDSNCNLNHPIIQISKILNAHVDSLNWIEENANVIQNQVDEFSKKLDDRLRDSNN